MEKFLGYDIIVLAGQSNADGFGVSKTCTEYDEKIELLLDKNLLAIYGRLDIDYDNFHKDLYPADIIKVKAYERKEDEYYKGCFAYTFAEEYKKSGLLKARRKLLIVKAAVGGTGFLKEQWGVNNLLYKRLCEMVDFALKQEGENKIVALLWHQGEDDTESNLVKSNEERFEYYYNSLLTMFKDFKKNYGLEKLPILCGEMAPKYKSKHVENAKAITDATKKVCADLLTSRFVSSDGLLVNKDETTLDDTCHFSYNSLIEFGKRYFNAYKEIIK